MAFDHRKFLHHELFDPEDLQEKTEVPCLWNCPPPPPPPPPGYNTQYHVPLGLTLFLCILGSVCLFLAFLKIIRCRRSSFRRRSTRVSQPLDDDNLRQDFIDESQGPVVEHHIWYIRTIGLPQSVIDSIGMFEYKKGEGLVDCSDCAVCLSEFEEDESLRLLPKCSHAFHVPCIDTWLRSHKNCPVCRAPVSVTESTNEVNVIEMSSSNNSVTSDDSQTENQSETRTEMEDDDEMRRRDESLLKTRLALEARERNKGLRVFSDLVDSRVKVDEPVRNSVSMDFDSALMVYGAINVKNSEGSSKSSPRIVEKQSYDVISNPSIYRLIKSSSYGRSRQKGHISMKRSASCSGSRFMNKHSKSQESVLALSELGTQSSR